MVPRNSVHHTAVSRRADLVLYDNRNTSVLLCSEWHKVRLFSAPFLFTQVPGKTIPFELHVFGRSFLPARKEVTVHTFNIVCTACSR